MSRLKRQEYFKSVVLLTAQRSTCMRGNVGAIITHENRIISTGYNGPLGGEKDCSSESCDLNSKCLRSIHAELNAILFAARSGAQLKGTTLWCTTMPCQSCARAIVQAGIEEVNFILPYTDELGLDILFANNILVHQI